MNIKTIVSNSNALACKLMSHFAFVRILYVTDRELRKERNIPIQVIQLLKLVYYLVVC